MKKTKALVFQYIYLGLGVFLLQKFSGLKEKIKENGGILWSIRLYHK